MKKTVTLVLLLVIVPNLFVSAQENVLFRDDFNDNTYKWNYDPNRQLNAYIEDSTLFVNNLSSIEFPARYVRNLFLYNDSNFIIETNIQFISKDDDKTAGLIWHSKDKETGFYFQISRDGKVKIWGNKYNRSISFLPWTDFPSLQNSHWYKLKVQRSGNSMDFYVNNTRVFNSPYRGQFGVQFGFLIGSYTNIRIDYIEVRHPPIRQSDKRISENLSDDDLFWIIKEQKYKEQISILGKIINMNTGGVVCEAEVSLVDTLGEELSRTNSDENGEFSIQTQFTEKVFLKIKKDNFLANSEEFNFSTDNESFERKRNYRLQPIEVGKLIALKNVLFEQGKARLLPESYKELNKLVEMMIENPNIEIELAGHTDISGSAEANLVLSEERVNSVKKYLVSKGVNEARITGKGYGGQFPIASNDSPLTRRLNRRVEFKIVKK